MATVLDLRTNEPVVGASVRIVSALDAVSGPENAPSLLETTTDELGQIDTTSPEPLDAAYAVLGLVAHPDHTITANGGGVPGSSGTYGPCLSERDWWAVSTNDFETWNESLAQDPLIEPYLPLENGVIIGTARQAEYPSTPLADVSIVPEAETSTAVVRYLEADGITFNDVATTDDGLFLVFGVAAGETFVAESEDFVATYPANLRVATFTRLAFIMKVWMSRR